jgi:hypothetical protein
MQFIQSSLSPESPVFHVSKIKTIKEEGGESFENRETTKDGAKDSAKELQALIKIKEDEIYELKKFINELEGDFHSFFEKTSIFFKRFQSTADAKENWVLKDYRFPYRKEFGEFRQQLRQPEKAMEGLPTSTSPKTTTFLNDANEFITKQTITKNCLLYVHESESEFLSRF